MFDPIESLSKMITNVFEVDQKEGDYAYVEDLEDGRGFTVTHYGFTENTGDLNEVIDASGLKDVLKLKQDRDGFPERWKQAITGKYRDKLVNACEDVARKLYWDPAMEAIAKDGLADNPLACAIYYDTLIQHGGGDDADSFYAIREKAKGDLSAFLEIRKKILEHATDPDTRDEWRDSVERVQAFEKLLKNPDLKGSLTISGHKLRGLA